MSDASTPSSELQQLIQPHLHNLRMCKWIPVSSSSIIKKDEPDQPLLVGQDVAVLHVKRGRRSAGCSRSLMLEMKTNKLSLLWKHTAAIVLNVKPVFTQSHVLGSAKPEL